MCYVGSQMASVAPSIARQSVIWRIFAATVTVGSFTTLAKVAGGAKVILMARYFGTSDALDAFLIALVLPSFVAETAAGSLIPSLIPTFIEVRQSKGPEAAQRLYSSVLAASAMLLTMLAVLLAMFSRWLLPLLGSNFGPTKLELTRWLFLWLLLWLPMSGLIVTWRAVLNAGELFAIAAAAPIMTPLLTILLLMSRGGSPGIGTLAAGAVGGITAEAAILAWSVHSAGYPLIPRWGAWSPELKTVFAQYLPMVAGTVIVGSTALVDQGMAGMLGAGSVSALAYGTKLVTVLLATGAAALGTAVLPHFSKMIAFGDRVALRHTVKTFAALIVAVSIPMVLLLASYSEPIVRLFYQRGAFAAAQTSVVATVQSYSLVQIPFAVLLAMAVKLASSLKANRLMLETAALALAVNVIADYVFMHWKGVAGIALAGAVVHCASLIYLTVALWWRMRGGFSNAPAA